jgi:hypothetical protein
MVSRLEEQAKRDSAFILVAEQVQLFIPWNSALSHLSAVASERCNVLALSHLSTVTS